MKSFCEDVTGCESVRVRLRVDRPWSKYPVGTKAYARNGGWWERVEGGWKPNASKDVFPSPGGDAVGECVELPNKKSIGVHHNLLLVQSSVNVKVSRCTVRVKTTAWADKRGLHTKKNLTFLRRQCEGFNLLEEDARMIGAEEVLPRITNLDDVEDGVYEVIPCNEKRDYENGCVDDYDYRLVEANEKRQV